MSDELLQVEEVLQLKLKYLIVTVDTSSMNGRRHRGLRQDYMEAVAEKESKRTAP